MSARINQIFNFFQNLAKNSILKKVRNQNGMTLVEIMIVLAILGAIIALVSSNISGALDKSKQREAKIQLGQVSQALQLYYTDCSKYPKSLEGLTKSDADCPNWGPEPYYKKKTGLKDPWNHELIYEATTSGYILKSLGKDGKEGGSGYNQDINSDDSEDSKSE